MSLDQNLFTLHLKPNEKDVNVVDLVDPSGTVHYRKRRIRDATPGGYKVEVYDPMSDSLLVTATALAASSKLKTLELCNPTQIVELKSTGTLSFKWAFQWEDNQYEWKKEACYMVRKPDPPVVVAVTREIPASKGVKTTSVQILDYNLNRFDIEDRKGLEIVILTSLMTFHDTGAPATEAPAAPAGGSGGVAVLGLSMPSLRRDNTTSSATGASNLSAVGNAKAPTPPPKPAPKTGVDRIADMQAMKEEVNVITVEDEGDIEDYAHYCCKLLEDDAMLFITVRSAAGEQVPKVLQVVEETRRQRHKAGLDEDEQLHQYVLYDTIPAQKGPKRINLDDDNKKSKQKYTPPNSLTVHISKIPMPELQPKASTAGASHSNLSKKDSKKKDDKYGRFPSLFVIL
ncbi:hypothetical protein BDN72DRAFT_765091 [Pluteus cervinus]|uniref:Uncharacterized protein n=1 Tax=Pluteus cervinus TaxID=181527 RepID=A0ACD3B177_9AGAR|nr:hypothetical protein BDN72DRAFT_765091 [Pluteus cervinus]